MDWDTAHIIEEYEEKYGRGSSKAWQFLRQAGNADNLDIGAEPPGWRINQDDSSIIVRTGGLLFRFDKQETPGLGVFGDLTGPRLWADSAYAWSLTYAALKDCAVTPVNDGTHGQVTEVATGASVRIVIQKPILRDLSYEEKSERELAVTIRCTMGACLTRVVYTIFPDENCFEEAISIENNAPYPVRILDWDFGLARQLTHTINYVVPSDLRDLIGVPIPWRRRPCDSPSIIQDVDLDTLCHRKRGFSPTGPVSQGFNSEVWALLEDDVGLLIMKYAPRHIEYSVLRTQTRDLECWHGIFWAQENRQEHLVFGGSTRASGDPSEMTLHPQGIWELGRTRYQTFNGNSREGFRLYKRYLRSRGHVLRSEYDPPLHWNELYDNQCAWWETDTSNLEASKNKHYTKAKLLEHAQKARDYHCESLYLDPGWDTAMSSSIWDEDRLGPLDDFLDALHRDYNLQVGLHTPLAGWCNPETYPEKARFMDKFGRIHVDHLCAGSRAYLDEKLARLVRLAQSGISFLMFDGSMYTGPCRHPHHGHDVPYTRDNHVRAYTDLARKVHAEVPEVLIEMHDFVVGPKNWAYCPVYLGHVPGGYDEYWGWELMWDPMDDLVSGQALSLYYYNLAYDIPLYLHLDLRKENRNCLMFWWFASTIRHLGIGGTHPDPAIQARLKSCAHWYLDHKKFYTVGEFHGINETAHMHIHPPGRTDVADGTGRGPQIEEGPFKAVINVFNFSAKTAKNTLKISNDLLGVGTYDLDKINLNIPEDSVSISRDSLIISVEVDAMSPALLEIGRDGSDKISIARIVF